MINLKFNFLDLDIQIFKNQAKFIDSIMIIEAHEKDYI